MKEGVRAKNKQNTGELGHLLCEVSPDIRY